MLFKNRTAGNQVKKTIFLDFRDSDSEKYLNYPPNDDNDKYFFFDNDDDDDDDNDESYRHQHWY